MIDPGDITIETWPPVQVGGQQVGTGPHGVKVTHTSGIVVCVDISRSQHKNKAIAMDAIEGAMTSPHWR